jgi:hypothetical protein
MEPNAGVIAAGAPPGRTLVTDPTPLGRGLGEAAATEGRLPGSDAYAVGGAPDAAFVAGEHAEARRVAAAAAATTLLRTFTPAGHLAGFMTRA